MHKLILFDWGNVLLDSDSYVERFQYGLKVIVVAMQ